MFEQDLFIPLNTNISPFSPNCYCNVHSGKGSSLVICHKSSISVINFTDSLNSEPFIEYLTIPMDGPENEEEFVIQAGLVNLEGTFLLIIITSRCIKVFAKDGFVLLMHILLSEIEESDKCPQPSARGIALFANSLYIGHASGSILRWTLDLAASKLASRCDSLSAHTESITHLDSNSAYMVSSDAAGTITVWEKADNPQVLGQFDSISKFPFTCVKLFKEWLIAGQSTGHIRIYDILKRRLLCEIMAHSKWISSIDVCLANSMIISCSEDTYIRLWKLNEDVLSCIAHYCSFRVPNTLLIGSAWLNKQGTAFVVSGYDSKQLYCFKQTDI